MRRAGVDQAVRGIPARQRGGSAGALPETSAEGRDYAGHRGEGERQKAEGRRQKAEGLNRNPTVCGQLPTATTYPINPALCFARWLDSL
ncbi:MAG: hypothetical protein ACYTXY_50185, partial [Nostoc sp.]